MSFNKLKIQAKTRELDKVKDALKLELDSLKQNLEDPEADFKNTMNLITLVYMDAKRLIEEIEAVSPESRRNEIRLIKGGK